MSKRNPTETEIKIILSLFKQRLNKLGIDPGSFNEKYLRDQAYKICQEHILEHPNEPIVIKLEGQK